MPGPDPGTILDAINATSDRTSFLQGLLREALGWPIPENVADPEEISYGWTKDELRAQDLDRSIVEGRIFQLQPLQGDQPWGVFLLEFKHPDAFTRPHGIAGPLRQVLRGLVPSRRRGSRLRAWQRENLLFICTCDYQHFRFAYFKAPREAGRAAPLASFGWSTGDSHIRTVCEFNLALLAWPEDPTPMDWTSAWARAFDVEAVTKHFFREIANWYFWALKHVLFPKDAPKEADGRDHVSVIRLITRLVFCWFVKEKGLIPDALFDERHLAKALVGFAPDRPSDTASAFYKAILQNLFFATLNTEIDKRGWAKDKQNFMGHSLYRYREHFEEPRTALDLFRSIPFLNGGLFECLDKDLGEKATPRYLRIDGFSRRSDSQPVVPDFLFFGGERDIDLSADYGDARFKRVLVRGLIRTFDHYRFTIAENTPLDQDVALDPELSGKVFENLLAAFNPETGGTARKQTGSFYTPRDIVNYMVDEALIACLKTKLEAAHASAKNVDLRIRHLFAYNHEPHEFTAPEVEALIAAIDSSKVLDPAVGSGAFPMGILHRLVFILGKLDPRNEKWKERQLQRIFGAIAAAEKIEDAAIRDRTVRELEQQIAGVNEAFERNELDYGRKLYLIENCIYGVDIQSIAVQIAKMRFFISLIVDQKANLQAPNLGIRPLPNLETKFVAANTLIGVHRPGQQMLRNLKIASKEAELRHVRERHFHARTLATKARYRVQDANLRAELAELLKHDGWETSTARKLAAWDPYDQNASAGFFDPEWMFGLTGGFDVVIGNPPYVVSSDPLLRELYKESVHGRPNLYGFFIHNAVETLLRPGGVLIFINPRTLLTDSYTSKLRKFVLKHARVDLVLNIVDRRNVFASVLQSTIVNMFQKRAPQAEVRVKTIESKEEIETAAELRIPLSDFLFGGPEPIFIVASSPLTYNIFRRVRALLTFDKAALSFTTGKIQWDLHAEVLSARQTKGSIRLIWAENVQRYWIAPLRTRADKAFINSTLKHFPPISGTTIVAQRVTAVEQARRIIATMVAADVFGVPIQFENHTSYLESNGSNTDLRLVLGLMNSALFDLLFRHTNSNTQVSAGELNSLPFPNRDPRQEGKIITLVDQILAAKKADPSTDTVVAERAIDQCVCRLYGLTPDEIRLVDQSAR